MAKLKCDVSKGRKIYWNTEKSRQPKRENGYEMIWTSASIREEHEVSNEIKIINHRRFDSLFVHKVLPKTDDDEWRRNKSDIAIQQGICVAPSHI